MAGKTAALPFESIDYEKAGIRLLPSQLARVCGVSKQAVSVWIKKGRIVLGSDGRVDPRQAFDRLAATGDISKLRMKILEPFRKEISELRGQVAELEVAVASRDRRLQKLEAELADTVEEMNFQTESSRELLAQFDRLNEALPASWEALRAAPTAEGCEVLCAWVDELRTLPRDALLEAGEIADYLPAPGVDGEGAGNHSETNPPPLAADHLEQTE